MICLVCVCVCVGGGGGGGRGIAGTLEPIIRIQPSLLASE